MGTSTCCYEIFTFFVTNQKLSEPIKNLRHGAEPNLIYLKTSGTQQKLTVHDTPAHNGVAERRNRTIVERIRALLHASGLPKSLWGEAARHVVWLMNRTNDVREWGEKVWVRVEAGTKLGDRVREGRWLGLDDKSNGARIYWPDKQTVSVERNIV